jgi:hypothetical protein
MTDEQEAAIEKSNSFSQTWKKTLRRSGQGIASSRTHASKKRRIAELITSKWVNL